MEKLLNRILNIIDNDNFPDGDKPYIIREVIRAWDDASEQLGLESWDNPDYRYGYQKAKEAIGELQQKELDERYDHGYRTGHVEGYNKGLSEFKDRWRTHGEAFTNGYNLGKDERNGYDYDNGHADGYSKGLSEFKNTQGGVYTKGYNTGFEEGKISRAVFKYTEKEQQEHGESMKRIGHDEGYSKGLEEGKKWCEEQLRATQDKYTVAQAQFVSSNNRLGALQADYTQLEKKYEEIKKAYKEMDEKRGDAWSRGYDKGRSHGRKWVKDEIINTLNNFNEEESE